MQFPEVTFTRKSRDYSSCELARRQRSNPPVQRVLWGDRTGGCQDLGPAPQDTLRTPKDQWANSLSFPTAVRDRADALLHNSPSSLNPTHQRWCQAPGSCVPDPRNCRKCEKWSLKPQRALLPQMPIKPWNPLPRKGPARTYPIGMQLGSRWLLTEAAF